MPKQRVGYHYTSWRNWLSIKKYGMRPYEINKPELQEYFDYYPLGIWCWTEEPSGKSEVGSILFQLSTKAQTKIVKLELSYTDDDLLYYEGNGYKQKILLYHVGHIEKWTYHENQEAVIITNPIPADKIKLVRVYDLMDINKEDKEDKNGIQRTSINRR
jgi:hypothetical protein